MKPDVPTVQETHLSSLTPDDRNANRGTARGLDMVQHSLQAYGAGRSILLDRNGRIVAGNKTVEAAGLAGMEDVLIVRTDGTKIVAVQRTDLDLDDPRARELAIADNRAAEVGLDWDPQVIAEFAEEKVALLPFFHENELNDLLEELSRPNEQETPLSFGSGTQDAGAGPKGSDRTDQERPDRIERDDAAAGGSPRAAADASPPSEFRSYDEDIETQYCCPKCSYAFTGRELPSLREGRAEGTTSGHGLG